MLQFGNGTIARTVYSMEILGTAFGTSWRIRTSRQYEGHREMWVWLACGWFWFERTVVGGEGVGNLVVAGR